jgi:hypothetical protein
LRDVRGYSSFEEQSFRHATGEEHPRQASSTDFVYQTLHEMPVYTANTQNNNTTVTSFVERGLGDLKPELASDVNIQVYSVGRYKGAYSQGIANVQDLIYATKESKLVHTSKPFRGILKDIPLKYIGAPPVSVRFNSLTEAQIEKLHSWDFLRTFEDSLEWAGYPYYENVLAMFDKANGFQPISRSSPGHVAPESYLVHCTVERGLIALANATRLAARANQDIRLDPIAFAANTFPDMTAMDFHGIQSQFGGMVTALETAFGSDTSTSYAELGPFSYLVVPLGQYDTFAENVIFDITGYTAPAAGTLFPYFPGLLIPDKDYVYNMTFKYLFRCLHDDPAEAHSKIKQMRQPLRFMASLPSGLVQAHMFMGIDLAITSQSAVQFLVDNTTYKGFTLINPDMRTLHRNTVIEPATAADLTSQVRQLNSHAQALITIASILSSVKLGNGVDSKYPISPSDIDTARKLNKALTITINKDDFQEAQHAAIDKAVKDLVYGDKYPKVNTESLLTFLRYVQSGYDKSLIEHEPMYYGGQFYKTESPLERGLLMFGNRAPSFLIGGNKIMTIPNKNSAVDTNMALDDDKNRNWRYMPWKMVSIKDAAKDWVKVFSTGRITLPNPRKERNEWIDLSKTSGHIHHEKGVEEVYGMLKAIVVNTANTGGGAAKRGREVASGMNIDEVEEGRKKKRSKAMATFASLFD